MQTVGEKEGNFISADPQCGNLHMILQNTVQSVLYCYHNSGLFGWVKS